VSLVRVSVELVSRPQHCPLVEAPATVTVFGAGRSGIAAAELLLDYGYRVRLTDSNSGAELEKACRSLAVRGATVSLGEQSAAFAAGSDFIVISPGIDERSELFAAPELDGIPVFGEVEIAYWYSPLPIVAVTGTNGKSTTVSLLGRMLAEAGIRNKVAGNIGLALCNAVRNLRDEEVIVAEISSFQLHTVESFHPRLALMLNLSPDHLERYDTVEQYYRSKFRMFEHMGPLDLAVFNAGDVNSAERAELAGDIPIAWFSRDEQPRSLAFVDGGALLMRSADGDPEEIIRLEDIPLRGAHNVENILAASCAALACGVDTEAIGRAVRSFEGLTHRLEKVGVVQDVEYFNDSKATTVDSVARALESFDEQLVLIMGGRHKGSPFTPLADEVGRRVRAIVAIGEAAEIIEQDLGEATRVFLADSLEQAVDKASAQARPGDAVLLCPGCSSFDMFTSYEQRGDEFRRLVGEREHSGA
jgi:UDP-N-acetylmuramoylalanine--D-glutamate ligase